MKFSGPSLWHIAALIPLFTAIMPVSAENLPRKLEAAQTVLENINAKGALLRNLPSAQSNPILAQAVENMDFQAVENQSLNLMMATFTEEELVALAAFQESPAGQSIQQKMPQFQQFIGTVMQEELMKALQNQVGVVPQGTLSR